MNYRHIYHAGNICDVVKHATLGLLLCHLMQKPKPLCVLDTHAGIGLYDLNDERALRTNEAKTGIRRLVSNPLPAFLDWYGDALTRLNPGWQAGTPDAAEALRFYPGSPMLSRLLLRPDDRLIACELHPEDALSLRRQFYDDPQAHIHHRDGYEALKALLPPAEKRGLVLIDPPFEQPDEYARLVKYIDAALTLWPLGCFLIWYPVKERPAIWQFHEALVALNRPAVLAAEFIYMPETRTDHLNGSGMILVNPPWQFEDKLRELFSYLHQALATEYKGLTLDWLRPPV